MTDTFIVIAPRDINYSVALINVASSNISRIGYDDLTERLYVQFLGRSGDRDGAIYEYADVPVEVYEALLSADENPAESVGTTFHRLVKTAGYPYRRMEG